MSPLIGLGTNSFRPIWSGQIHRLLLSTTPAERPFQPGWSLPTLPLASTRLLQRLDHQEA